jgi:hypothetical protein
MTTTLRVTSTDDRLTRFPRSWASAEERARRVALLMGSSEIQRREGSMWRTVERFERVGERVSRRTERAGQLDGRQG